MEKDTFSSSVKEELCRVKTKSHAEAYWELMGLRWLTSRETDNHDGTVVSGRPVLMRRMYYLEKQAFGKKATFRKCLKVKGTGVRGELVISRNKRSLPISILLTRPTLRRSYLRGVFLARGSVQAPSRGHHLEISLNDRKGAMVVRKLLQKDGLKTGIVSRRTSWVVYMKDADTISEFLKEIGATNAVLEYEDVRARKDLKSSIQRLVNMDRANVTRIVDAALKQVEDIRLIDEYMGLDSLSPALKDVAAKRLENPDLSMEELGELMDPPITKSAVNHRFRRLSRIAASIRNRMGKSQVSEKSEEGD